MNNVIAFPITKIEVSEPNDVHKAYGLLDSMSGILSTSVKDQRVLSAVTWGIARLQAELTELYMENE